MNDSTDNAKPIRVLHIGKYFPPHRGGMETYLRDLMSTQTRQGLKVMALVHSSLKCLRDTSTDIHAGDGLYFNIVRAARWFNLGYVPISPFFALSLSKQIRAFKPDVIHIHAPNASAVWALSVSGARALPWIIQWHSDILTPSSGWVTRASYRAFQLIETRLLSKASLILATSRAYLDGSASLQKYQHKCEVIPLGLDASRLPSPANIKPQQRPKEHRHQLLFLGRLSAYKGVSTLLEAMQLLDLDIGLWIVGDGEDGRRIAKTIERLGLSSRVHMVKRVDDAEKWGYIKSADAVVLPSINKNEAFGMVMLEAAAFGTHIVASNIEGSGVGWVASRHPNYVLVEPGVSESLATGIMRALDSSSTTPRNHLTTVELDLEASCHKMIGAYASLLTGRELR